MNEKSIELVNLMIARWNALKIEVGWGTANGEYNNVSDSYFRSSYAMYDKEYVRLQTELLHSIEWSTLEDFVKWKQSAERFGATVTYSYYEDKGKPFSLHYKFTYQTIYFEIGVMWD